MTIIKRDERLPEWSEVMEAHYDDIVDAICEMEREDYRYEVCLYLYRDGSTSHFVTAGSNSWLDVDATVVYRSNHEFYDDDYYDEDGNLDIDESDLREWAIDVLDRAIEEAELDEEQRREWEEMWG